MPQGLVELLLSTAISVLITNYRGKFHDILAKVADRLNDKIEGTETQLDDTAKDELVNAFETAFLPQLKVDGVDGPVGEDA